MLWRDAGGSRRPEALGLGAVEPAIGIDRDAVLAPCLVRADQAVEHVVEHALRVALTGIAEAAAARQLEADRIARRHRLAPFRPDRTARAQRDAAGRPRLSAIAAARRIVHAL